MLSGFLNVFRAMDHFTKTRLNVARFNIVANGLNNKQKSFKETGMPLNYRYCYRFCYNSESLFMAVVIKGVVARYHCIVKEGHT